MAVIPAGEIEQFSQRSAAYGFSTPTSQRGRPGITIQSRLLQRGHWVRDFHKHRKPSIQGDYQISFITIYSYQNLVDNVKVD